MGLISFQPPTYCYKVVKVSNLVSEKVPWLTYFISEKTQHPTNNIHYSINI